MLLSRNVTNYYVICTASATWLCLQRRRAIRDGGDLRSGNSTSGFDADAWRHVRFQSGSSWWGHVVRVSAHLCRRRHEQKRNQLGKVWMYNIRGNPLLQPGRCSGVQQSSFRHVAWRLHVPTANNRTAFGCFRQSPRVQAGTQLQPTRRPCWGRCAGGTGNQPSRAAACRMWNYVISGRPPGRHGAPAATAPVGKPAAGFPGAVFPRRRAATGADAVE